MLPTSNRLPSPQIKSVMRRGRRVNGAGVQLIVARNTLPVSRFAFIVPIRTQKRAAARNRARRLVRESVRLTLPAIAPGWDGVFLINIGLPDVRELLGRAGLLP